ncbi:GIY-YIG nuclease family protein [Hyphobacterium sp.]|jgi:putative endonuclease|uniref:GIY-YIG nuclease family protein n=1 Tax=Hyphobacterium sp. TaxID=2004662 RepID=UPI003BAAFCFA
MRRPPKLIWVYILRCADGSYYTGTHRGEDMSQRVAEHQAGCFGGYTASRRPVELVWADWSFQLADAVAFERQVKGWSRAKKEAFIAGDWESLKRLSKRRGGQPSS